MMAKKCCQIPKEVSEQTVKKYNEGDFDSEYTCEKCKKIWKPMGINVRTGQIFWTIASPELN